MRIFYLGYNIDMIKNIQNIKKLKFFILLRIAYKRWVEDFNTYAKITLIVAIPSAILGLLQNNGILSDYGLIMAVAWAYAFISIIYFSFHRKKLQNNKLSEIYTTSSSRFLQFLGVSLILAIFALPFAVGLVGLFLSLPVLGLPPFIFLPISIIGLVLSSYLLARFGMAQIISVVDQLSVIDSLRASSKITFKNRWRIFFGTSLVLLLFLLMLVFVQFLLNLNLKIAQNQIIYAFVNILEACLVVPIFYAFQTEIYRELNGKK